MKNVILMLEGLKDIPVPPSPVRLVVNASFCACH
ncbi:hypothetical protein A2U01_0069481 [Trifolium medium]|uniref:Uncharacterized protein n=1 Tax=Trifolium medium TaxID=97028 RepID=A0A392SH73_9FABA|nr:hypothetical protein [Trifolium medium]